MNIEKLEDLNKEIYGGRFIRSFPMLRITDLTPTKIRLIELILSFQSKKQQFQMRYEKIADYIGAKGENKEQTVANNVKALKKLNLISTKNDSNYKGDKIRGGGSKTFLDVNIEEVYKYVESFRKEESSTEPVTPTEPIKEVPVPKVNPTEPIKEVPLPKVNPTEPIKEVPLPKVNPTEPIKEVPVPLPTPKITPTLTKVVDTPTEDEEIIFEDFNVIKTLRRYTNDETLINKIDIGYLLYRGENNLHISKLDDLVLYIVNEELSRDITGKILDDLIKIGKIKLPA